MLPLMLISPQLCFSALQRAENSSMKFMLSRQCTRQYSFSALQRAENSSMMARVLEDRINADVSVLFSEPKIPQWLLESPAGAIYTSFSALQRAENSSIAAP